MPKNTTYDYCVPNMLLALNNMQRFLKVTKQHCEKHSIHESAFTSFRLFPNMLHFAKQVQIGCNFALRGAYHLCGKTPPKMGYVEASLSDLIDTIEETKTLLLALNPDEFDATINNPVHFSLRTGTKVTYPNGELFLKEYALPNFYFHVTTVFNIIRHNGVVIGKQDFIGSGSAVVEAKDS